MLSNFIILQDFEKDAALRWKLTCLKDFIFSFSFSTEVRQLKKNIFTSQIFYERDLDQLLLAIVTITIYLKSKMSAFGSKRADLISEQ